ncbi:MAG: cytochrome c [Acidobacteria bacterium]|nr:cytochrome c [Acidobacteriota bacterium]
MNLMNLWRRSCILFALFVFPLCVVSAGFQENEKEKNSTSPTEEAGSRKNDAAQGDPANGQQVFADNCQTCHYADSEEANIGPGLKGLFKKPPHKMADGTEHTQHTVPMIREQILKGSSAMPPAGSALSEGKLDDLIAYLQTL